MKNNCRTSIVSMLVAGKMILATSGMAADGQPPAMPGPKTEFDMEHNYVDSSPFPAADAYRRRVRMQLSNPLQQQQQGASAQSRSWKNESTKPLVSEYNGRKVITLDHGSSDAPFLVRESGRQSLQFSFISKWLVSKGSSSQRLAKDFDEARSMKWSKTPKSANDFETWSPGDWVEKNGITGIILDNGINLLVGNAKLGGHSERIWARRIIKLSPNLVQVTFFSDKKDGPVAHTQLLSLHKALTKNCNSETMSFDYVFDLNKNEDRGALEMLLDTPMLRVKSLMNTDEMQSTAPTGSMRRVYNSRTKESMFQVGVPFAFQYRHGRYVDTPVSVITNAGSNLVTTVTSRSFVNEDMHQALNPGNHEKKWRNFSHRRQQYKRAYTGTVTSVEDTRDQSGAKMRMNNLDVKIYFSHDNAKVSTVNKYVDAISREIGLTHVMLDTGYTPQARIGFVEIVYTLQVGHQALLQLAAEHEKAPYDFITYADDRMEEYFYLQKDPNRICFEVNPRPERHCISAVFHDTARSLQRIQKYLQRLYKSDNEISDNDSAKYLAKIAKELSTNHFVLHSFLRALPSKKDGYGTLEISGERFQQKTLIHDADRI